MNRLAPRRTLNAFNFPVAQEIWGQRLSIGRGTGFFIMLRA
jgi:hypothetical protein